MKTNSICLFFALFLVSNVLFGQRKETVSISLDEIKDMPQKSANEVAVKNKIYKHLQRRFSSFLHIHIR